MQTCAVLNFKEQRIEYYDSLKGVDSTTINSLLRWVEDEYADKYSEDLPERFQVGSSCAVLWDAALLQECPSLLLDVCRRRTGRKFSIPREPRSR